MGDNDHGGFHSKHRINHPMSIDVDHMRPLMRGDGMGPGIKCGGMRTPSDDAGLPRADRALTTSTSADRLRRGGHTSLGSGR